MDVHVGSVPIDGQCILSSEASLAYQDHEKDQMVCLDLLASYHVQRARKEKDKGKKRQYFTKVQTVQGCG